MKSNMPNLPQKENPDVIFFNLIGFVVAATMFTEVKICTNDVI